MSNRPIGVFDSGVGGLSLLSQVRELMPSENLIYLADSAAAPYGDKDAGFVTERVLQIAGFFKQHNIKLIVMACNTATTAAVAKLREYCDVPVVAIEPAIKPAALLSKNGVIGVMATKQTVSTDYLSKLTARHASEQRVLFQACPGLVELVEAGQTDSAEAEALLRKLLAPLLEESIDTLVLGCTHYPFLKKQIEKITGDDVLLLDPANAVATQVKRVLESHNLLLEPEGEYPQGDLRFFTTGDQQASQRVMSLLWKSPVSVSRCNIDA